MSARQPVSPRTVVEAFLPLEGTVELRLVYDTANAAGVADHPLRLTIRRLVTAGEVVHTGRGRKGTLSLTGLGRERLNRDRLATRLALAQDTGEAGWDGRWHLIAVSSPEDERAARDLIRRRLTEVGAAPVSTGLYLSPHDLTELLDAVHLRHLVRATAGQVDVRGVSEPLALAELLWPAAPIVAGYGELDAALARARLLPDTAAAEIVLTEQLRLAEALERALRPDPLIPVELRNVWPPSTTRREWLAEWTRLTGLLPRAALYRGWLD